MIVVIYFKALVLLTILSFLFKNQLSNTYIKYLLYIKTCIRLWIQNGEKSFLNHHRKFLLVIRKNKAEVEAAREEAETEEGEDRIRRWARRN